MDNRQPDIRLTSKQIDLATRLSESKKIGYDVAVKEILNLKYHEPVNNFTQLGIPFYECQDKTES